jgi:hypothetical protein
MGGILFFPHMLLTLKAKRGKALQEIGHEIPKNNVNYLWIDVNSGGKARVRN